MTRSLLECCSRLRQIEREVDDSDDQDQMMSDAERWIAVESAVAHVQHENSQLHELVLSLQQELRTVVLRLERLERQLAEQSEPAEVRSPDLERPPHY
jgi:uncharacterized coiled-coil protein SlyX